MKSNMTVSAIIPTLTNTSGLERVIEDLLQARISVVVVDNKPNGKKKRLTEKVGAVYLPQKENVGFARAVNVGVRHTKTEWILILNDDVELETRYKSLQVLDALIETAEKNKWVAVSPVLVASNGNIENIGYTVLPIGKVELNFDPKKNTSDYLDGLTAACLLIRREVFKDIGGFDESFFAYLEDVDLFLRLKENGYTFGVAMYIEVIHRHQQTSKHNPKKKTYLDMVNWWRVVMKHPKKFWLSPTLPQMLVERGRNVSGWIKG